MLAPPVPCSTIPLRASPPPLALLRDVFCHPDIFYFKSIEHQKSQMIAVVIFNNKKKMAELKNIFFKCHYLILP